MGCYNPLSVTFARVWERARRVFPLPPIVVIAGAWFAGTLALHQLARLPSAAAYVPLALAALLALRFAATRWVAWAIAGFAWTAITAQQQLDQRLAADPPQREVAIAGYVDGFPTFAPGQVTFSFAVAGPRPERADR